MKVFGVVILSVGFVLFISSLIILLLISSADDFHLSAWMTAKVGEYIFLLACTSLLGVLLMVSAKMVLTRWAQTSDYFSEAQLLSVDVDPDLTEEDDADEDEEESVLDIAKRIAKDEWTILRTHASVLINEDYELVWYLLVFIENNGEIEQLVVTDDHDDYLVYFTAKEGDWLLFSTVEDSLSDEGPGDPSDYLKPSKDKSNLDVY